MITNIHSEWTILRYLTFKVSETVLIYVVICDKCETLTTFMSLKLVDVKLLIHKCYACKNISTPVAIRILAHKSK